ncbi:protein containing Translation elongation factor EFG/EF2, domain protein IV domain protein, partial [gut metagenome]
GAGLSHLNYIIEKMRNTYKVELLLEEPKIVYRESITRVGTGDGKYVKQSGGAGFYGVVQMRFEPADEVSFSEEIFGGAVPKNYFPAVEKGFLEALQQGPLAGFPVIGVRAVLVDGKYHPVDSNEMAFKMAAILAFKDAYQKCRPIILEPVCKINVNVSNEYIGDVLSNLNN